MIRPTRRQFNALTIGWALFCSLALVVAAFAFKRG